MNRASQRKPNRIGERWLTKKQTTQRQNETIMPKSKKERPSSTPGRTKGSNCQKSQLKNQYAKDSRFYKNDPVNYAKVCHLVNQEKGNLSNGSPWIKEILES